MRQEKLTARLSELEQQYDLMQSRIAACHQKSPAELHQLHGELLQECQQSEAALQARVAALGSSSVTELYSDYQAYSKKVSAILQQEMPQYIHSDPASGQLEASALFAEYAIDFAAQAAKHALLAALSTMLDYKEEPT